MAERYNFASPARDSKSEAMARLRLISSHDSPTTVCFFRARRNRRLFASLSRRFRRAPDCLLVRPAKEIARGSLRATARQLAHRIARFRGLIARRSPSSVGFKGARVFPSVARAVNRRPDAQVGPRARETQHRRWRVNLDASPLARAPVRVRRGARRVARVAVGGNLPPGRVHARCRAGAR